MRVLVIDDSRAMRPILTKMLNAMGFEVHDATDGNVALEKLEELGKVELCLVDWNMPNMNGYEFVQAVRAEPSWASVKLMMVTTETEVEQMARALEAGADEYVMKPFTKDVINEKLDLLGLAPSSQ